MQNSHYAVSWNGGKDSCMALYEALAKGSKVSHIVNFISDNPQKVRFHSTHARIIGLQSRALNIPLFQKVTSWEEYERDFKAGVGELKSAGLKGMVFHDIYLNPHREWVEHVCGEIGVEAREPLWGMDTGQLMARFIGLGLKSVIICAKADLIKLYWLGRVVDTEFMQYLINRNVDPFGENGEYHTLVVDGTLFRRKVELMETDVYEHTGYYLLDIPSYTLSST